MISLSENIHQSAAMHHVTQGHFLRKMCSQFHCLYLRIVAAQSFHVLQGIIPTSTSEVSYEEEEMTELTVTKLTFSPNEHAKRVEKS
jgi:hypothetical protein